MSLSTRMLTDNADDVSPEGGAEIRHILASPQGDLTHAVCPAGQVAPAHHLPELHEQYYVLAGRGEIWRATAKREAVTALRPGRWVQMSAGTRFQYRANHGTSLVFLVVVLPSWRPELFHTDVEGAWHPGVDGQMSPTKAADLLAGWMSATYTTVTMK
jgi:mannose-6-phosphate isomerase-like protein (cupin superfamily)